MSIFSDRLKEILDRRGMSQRDLAIKIETTEVSVSRYISGDRIPKGPIVLKIAQALNVQTDWLLGNDSWFDCGSAVGPDERGGCNCCNIERRDFEFSTTTVSMGDFGDDYELSVYISQSRKAIAVDFGRKQYDPIITFYSDKIKYCPYCGRRLLEVTE